MSHAVPQFDKESDGGGRFVRQDSRFRDVVEERPDPGRYRLYVSLACPWASRAVIVRQLKGLESILPMTVVDPVRDDRGWRFADDAPDPVNGFAFLQQAYELTDPDFADRVTVPVLLINNEENTGVDIQQTRKMHSALKSAGKTVEFPEFKAEDNWKIVEASRITYITYITDFLKKYNPA